MLTHMAKDLSKVRVRAWCFTLNNPEVAFDWKDFYMKLPCRYLIVGDEVGDSGTPHHQGYVSFVNAIRFKACKDRLPAGAHIEPARGTPLQNQTYCSKANKVIVEKGDIPFKGKRTDIEEVRDQLKAGVRMGEICDTAHSYQSIRGAELILKYKEAKRDWLPQVHWLWGATGTGKTRHAVEQAPDAWMSGKTLRWWDGYDAHEDIIIDDFRADFCTYHELLRILDRYAYRVEVKGGSRQLLAKRIYITCPVHPRDVYQTVEDKQQLMRRITTVMRFPLTEPVADVPDIAQESAMTILLRHLGVGT